VGQADLERRKTEVARAGSGGAVQVDGGFPMPVIQAFKLSPEDTAHAGAQGLGDGLLAGKAGGEFLGSSTAVLLFSLSVEAAAEAVADAVDCGLDAGDFDGVHAGGEAAIRRANCRSAPRDGRRTDIPSRYPGPQGGVAEPVPAGFPPTEPDGRR